MAAEGGEPPADEPQPPEELPHQEIPLEFKPTVDFSSLEARLKERLDEQLEMFTRQADLRTRLKAIQDACAEEETERQALEEKLQQTATDLEQKVAEVCAPVEQLKEKTATAAEVLEGFAAAETALRETAKESEAIESRRWPRTAEDIPDQVAAAGRQVQEWSERSAVSAAAKPSSASAAVAFFSFSCSTGAHTSATFCSRSVAVCCSFSSSACRSVSSSTQASRIAWRRVRRSACRVNISSCSSRRSFSRPSREEKSTVGLNSSGIS
jgi:hypothetical protein